MLTARSQLEAWLAAGEREVPFGVPEEERVGLGARLVAA
jgi:hypothetical protein